MTGACNRTYSQSVPKISVMESGRQDKKWTYSFIGHFYRKINWATSRHIRDDLHTAPYGTLLPELKIMKLKKMYFNIP